MVTLQILVLSFLVRIQVAQLQRLSILRVVFFVRGNEILNCGMSVAFGYVRI